MRSPLTALTWEIWGQSRRSVWLLAGVISTGMLLARIVTGKPNAFENIEAVFWLLMVSSFFLVFGIFNYAEFNPGRNWHGFPYRLFTLPVPTRVLVACPMLLGVVAVSLVYLAWAKLVFAPLGKVLPFWPALVLGVGIICYQALVWSLAGFRIIRMIVLGLVGLLLMDFAIMPAYPELMVQWPLNKVLHLLTLVLIGFTVIAFLGAWFSVERQRRGGARGRGLLQEQIGRLIDALPRRTRGFASPAAAQSWFEWRRGGIVLPVCSGAVLLLVFGPVSWLTRKNSEMTLWTLGWVLALPVILSSVIGKGFTKPDFWSRDLSLSPFLAIRPLASGEMVVTKMKVAALSVATTWLLALTFLLLWLPGWANTTGLKEQWDTLLALHSPLAAWAILILFLWAAVVLTWRGMVGSLWVGLSGDMRRWVASAILQILAVIVIFWVIARLKDSGWRHVDRNVSLMGWTLALIATLKLWVAVFSWKKISPGRVWKYVLIWTGGTLCLVALGRLVCPNIFWLKHLFILAALLPFPLARLGFAPGSLTKNRHR